jgi:Ca-activated chloride channel family protein
MIKFKLLLLIWTLFMAILPLHARAVTEIEMQQTTQPELYMRDLVDGRVAAALQLDTEVQIDISGLISRVVVRQRFSNDSDNWQEGIYVFPLPDTAAVDHMRLWIGERFIEGDIEERQVAEQLYKEAKSEGKQAGLVRQERANIFTTSVANIAPHDEIVVEIEYQQDVHFEHGQFSLRFPMVVAPRYIPGKQLTGEISGFNGTGWAQNTDQVPDASSITPQVIDDTDSQAHSLSLQINLDAGMPLTVIDSPYHPVDINEMAEGEYRILLQEGSVRANRDFQLIWRADTGHEPTAAWFVEHRAGAAAGYYGLLMLMPPAAEQLSIDIPRELILLVDASGSMHGASMEQAKAALELAINRLDPTDSFNIIQFNHDTHSLFDTARTATADNLRQALDYVSDLEAEGGTEMLPALELALDADFQPGVLRQVVFITDGAVGNEHALFRLIRQELGNARLFTIGIGSAPNSYFMTRAAEAGRGSFTYIGQVSEVQEKMQQLFHKLESPALTDIELDWGQEVQQWPGKVTDLYAGEPVLVSVRSDQPLSGLLLKGMLGKQSWTRDLQLNGGGSAAGMHVLWARKQIRELMSNDTSDGDEEALRSTIVDLAKAHHLVSRYTSLVAVDKTPVRPADAELESQSMPVSLPEGWSAEKVFGVLPQTATSAELQLIIGMLSLLLAGLIWRVRREA